MNPFRTNKRSQLFIGTHDETLETQPGLHPASWSLSALIFQYFTSRARSVLPRKQASCLVPRLVRLCSWERVRNPSRNACSRPILLGRSDETCKPRVPEEGRRRDTKRH